MAEIHYNMSFEDQIAAIENAMHGMGYMLCSKTTDEKPFGNGAAEFERLDSFRVRVTIDRDDVQIDIQPRRGFASLRWYDALGFLKQLESLGYHVVCVVDDSPSSTERFIEGNLELLLGLKDKIEYSYFDGLGLKVERK